MKYKFRHLFLHLIQGIVWLLLLLVSGPTPNKALFKELVAPLWGILFDGSSVFSSHLRYCFHLLSLSQPGKAISAGRLVRVG